MTGRNDKRNILSSLLSYYHAYVSYSRFLILTNGTPVRENFAWFVDRQRVCQLSSTMQDRSRSTMLTISATVDG